MGILSSLFSAVAGLNSTGASISIIGDNISNSNTVGFKASRPEFVDVLSSNIGGGSGGSVGAGSRLSNVSQTFTQGPFESTDVTTDLAIDGGGFFIVQDTNGIFYTRAGGFRLDASQILVNGEGQTVQGFGITPGGAPNGALGTIDLSTVSSTPQATSTVNVNVNLGPNQAVPAAFDQTDPVTTSNFQTGIRMFDSLGNPRNILIYMRKAGTLAVDVPVVGLPSRTVWEYFAGSSASELDPSVVPAAAGPNDFVAQDWGLLEFNSSGALVRALPDDLFSIYAGMYSYDGTPLNAETESVDSMPDWTREEVSFDAAYGGERVTAFLFLPTRSTPPYQTIIYFPGAGAVRARSNSNIQQQRLDFIIRSGRAAIGPATPPAV